MNPLVLPLREQDALSRTILRKRLATVLPEAMRSAGIDMWLILCHEDNYDPIFSTMVPVRTWAPILQMLIFHDRGDDAGVECLNLSMSDLGDLYQKVWHGFYHTEQWLRLAEIVAERDPRRIGINIGDIQWCAGGLTSSLHRKLVQAFPEKYVERLVSAEGAATHWASTLIADELHLYPHIVRTTKQVIADCYSPGALIPGVTTSEDLQWAFMEYSRARGLDLSFVPFFSIRRNDVEKARFPVEDKIIRPGDLLHCDVGHRYLRLCSDLQEWAYVRRSGEADAPAGMRALWRQVGRLQKIFLESFATGLTGNDLLTRMLERAHAAGIPYPRIYSHGLGYFLHEPGPLIGLPWEQRSNPGRGDVRLAPNTVFTMELSIEDAVPEWGGQKVRLAVEHDVCFTGQACVPFDRVQEDFYLI